jgi:hypothetical protein
MAQTIKFTLLLPENKVKHLGNSRRPDSIEGC